jgi:hypothetical protein
MSYQRTINEDDSSSTSSENTLLDEDSHGPHHSSGRRDSLTAWGDDERHHSSVQRLFPFHLISACSTAQRDMCQFALREELGLEAQGRIGFRGT